jgi:hypothetical protein
MQPNQATETINEFDQYVNGLIEQKGFTELTPETKNVLSIELKKDIDRFIMMRGLAEFSEKEITTYKQMLAEKRSLTELRQFAMDQIPDYPAFLTNCLVEFKDAYLQKDNAVL